MVCAARDMGGSPKNRSQLRYKMSLCEQDSLVYDSQQYLLTGVDMAGFSKVFSTMWGGSLYGKFEASAVFMVLLSLCDRDGVVDMTPEAIAGLTGWPLDVIQRGIEELAAPDPRSRTPNEEGRRILLVDDHRDWGWRITNYLKYRDEMRAMERREYLRQAKQKERKSKMSTDVNTSTNVNQCQPIADTDTDTDTDINPTAWGQYVQHRKEKRHKMTPLSEAKQKNVLRQFSFADQQKMVDITIANGWTGLFPERVRDAAHKQGTSFNDIHARNRQAAGLD